MSHNKNRWLKKHSTSYHSGIISASRCLKTHHHLNRIRSNWEMIQPLKYLLIHVPVAQQDRAIAS